MDYLSLKAAATEAAKAVVGRKFSGSRAVDPCEILLLFGRSRTLQLSIDPDLPGLYMPPPDSLRKRARSVFSDLLNSRLEGSSLSKIYFPIPGDRIVRMEFTAGWPRREGRACSLVLEVMGRHSNLILLDEEDRILAPLKPVARSKSRLRPIVPGKSWTPPPRREGVPLESVTTDDLPDPSGVEAAGILVKRVIGLSPGTARLALKRTGDKGKRELAAVLGRMLKESDGSAGFILGREGRRMLLPFSWPQGEGESVVRFRAFSQAAWQWKNTADQTGERQHENGPGTTLQDLSTAQERIQKELGVLAGEEKRCREHEVVRLQAQTILIHAENIPTGSPRAELPHPLEKGKSVSVILDPAKSARENADNLFRQARRLKRGLAEIEKRTSLLLESRQELERVKEELERGNEKPALEFLQANPVGPAARTSGEKGPKHPGRAYRRGDFTILVGKSAADNEKVTFLAAGPHDLWLHTRDYPGSHVVILTGRKTPPREIIEEAARLAIAGSGAKNDPSAEVMITERKWVRKIRGGKQGQVRVERYRTVRMPR